MAYCSFRLLACVYDIHTTKLFLWEEYIPREVKQLIVMIKAMLGADLFDITREDYLQLCSNINVFWNVHFEETN